MLLGVKERFMEEAALNLALKDEYLSEEPDDHRLKMKETLEISTTQPLIL